MSQFNRLLESNSFYLFCKPKGQLCLEDPGRKCTGQESLLTLTWFHARREAGQRWLNCDTLSRLTTSDFASGFVKIYITQTLGNPCVVTDNKSFPESRTNCTKPLITLRRVIFFCSLSHNAAQDKKCSDKNKSKQICALAALLLVRNWSGGSKEGWSWMTSFMGLEMLDFEDVLLLFCW